ncbi:MAG: PAS domain S-box protein [Acidobacteria bacterium]|nr:PAS domain S-box protein [Acidobacteriota bacterium]
MFEQVFEASTDSIVCIDPNWSCSFANRAAHALLKSDNLIGKNLWTDFPGNQNEPFASNYRKTMHQRVTTEFEAYYAAPLDIWFKVSARPIGDGADDGIVIFSNDITDRKRAEALGNSYARQLKQVFEATTDAVLMLDRNWNLSFLNSRAAGLLGRGDLLGKNLWQEFPRAVESEFSEAFYRCMEHGVEGEVEAFYPAPLNRWFAVQVRASDDGIVLFFRDITDRMRRTAQLEQQRELIEFVQQAARTAIWTLELDTGKLSFDSGSYPVFGHPFSSIGTVLDFRKIVHPEDSAQVTADVARAVEQCSLLVNEFRVIDEQGNTIWLEARSQVSVEEGVPVRLGGMTIDITERKRSEQALAASEERYRILAELSPQFIWTGSPDGAITYANQGFLDYLGFTLDDVGPDRWPEAFDPLDRDRVIAAWAHSITSGQDYDIEARLVAAADGQSRWYWLRAQPLRDASGRIVNWLGVTIDIHDRKTAADAMHQKHLETERQRAELETIYRTAPIGLALYDPVDLRYLRLNDRQAESVGLPPDRVLGRRLHEITPLPGLERLFERVIEGHPVRNELIEVDVPQHPEERRFWSVSCSPVRASDGSIQSITAAYMEVTNQKKAELALIQSEKLAAVGRLASSISHEINNPLEAVTNLLYLIGQSDSLDNDLRFYINSAQSELARVCQIATQTLRFHRQAVRATRVTAEEMVGDVVNLYQGRLANSNIDVRQEYRSATTVLCFENDIRQVLNNLIANAIDAMRQGGRLTIRAYDAVDSGGPGGQLRTGIRITIADNGMGMSAAVQARVFEPFYTTKDLNGTGLGLWISEGIIARHHGSIRVRSTDHPRLHGTVFSLFLPHLPESEIETVSSSSR